MKKPIDKIIIIIIIICAILVSLVRFDFLETNTQYLGIALWLLIPMLILNSVRGEIKYRKQKKKNQKPY